MVTETSKEIKKNWFVKHWIISIFLGLIVLGMIGSMFEGNSKLDLTGKVINDNSNNNVINLGSSQGDNSLITKSPDEMLPVAGELPTEYSIGEKEDITKDSSAIVSRNAQVGFDSGKILSISQYKVGAVTVTDYTEVTFGIYKFDNSNYASNFKNSVMNEIKNEGGYTELDLLPECFAWKQDYGYSGGRIGESICDRGNIVFWTSVSLTNSFKQPDNILEDMTEIMDKKVR